MEFDDSKIEEAVLALLAAFSFESGRSWKGFDFDVMDRLHQKGCIISSRGRAKSVQLSPGGLARGLEIATVLFGEARR
jgi:hypothetical protein